jgi:hypothetical protein
LGSSLKAIEPDWLNHIPLKFWIRCSLPFFPTPDITVWELSLNSLPIDLIVPEL